MSSIFRGDVCTIRARPGARGHEQQGRRYAVVLQTNEFQWLNTVVVAPTSTAAQPAIFRPELKIRGKTSRVLIDQLVAADRTRIGAKVAHLSPYELAEIELALERFLGLT